MKSNKKIYKIRRIRFEEELFNELDRYSKKIGISFTLMVKNACTKEINRLKKIKIEDNKIF